LTALCTVDGNFDALPHACGLCGGDGREAFVLGLLAGLAALRLVLQALVVEKDLFASRPRKILAAIDAMNRAVLKLYLGLTPLSIRAASVCLYV
jgi:hypothetical protein